MPTPTTFERFSQWSRESVTLKMIAVGFLILVLLIPDGFKADWYSS